MTYARWGRIAAGGGARTMPLLDSLIHVGGERKNDGEQLKPCSWLGGEDGRMEMRGSGIRSVSTEMPG